MAAIKSKANPSTELKVAALFRANGITGWRRHSPIAGRPDFVFPRKRVAIFVDGCFWHGCPQHGREPDSRQAYWGPKLARNKARDRQVTRLLRKLGWTVLRIWHHELRSEHRVLGRCFAALRHRWPSKRKHRSSRTAANRFASRSLDTPRKGPSTNQAPVLALARLSRRKRGKRFVSGQESSQNGSNDSSE